MLGVEDEVNGGEADVLVAAAVAGHEVGVEQLVVVGDLAALEVRRNRVARDCIVVSLNDARARGGRIAVCIENVPGTALCAMSLRNSVPCTGDDCRLASQP